MSIIDFEIDEPSTVTADTAFASPAAAAAAETIADGLLPERGAGTLIAARGDSVHILLAGHEDAAVRRAVEDLARDLAAVSGARTSITDASVTGALAEDRIVVGTIGCSPLVDAAIHEGRLDISGLKDDKGALRWEGFLVTLVDDVLHLVGADRRGTIFAIYEFTRAIGVSPWYWWGDVPIPTRDHVTLRSDLLVIDWPSVRYRGVFLNDEEELYHWALAHTSDGTIGPTVYARVYELILRLKGNYLWPAMHVGAFNHDPENGRLAHEMGVVIGTSHCDMLLRSNEHEFTPWAAERGGDVQYDYSLSGRNREMLQEYWRGSVEQNCGYEVTWTVGMRGVHDSGFVTTAIDDDPSLTEEDKLQTRVRLLETVMHDQRALLAEGLGAHPSEAPQLFIPYKEVLPLYDAGLEVPEDITMVWANDSFGYIRRFPNQVERRRRGGHGLYYHSSYWSNYTTSYLATSSTPLALMKSELRKAWDSGIRELWVDNIGGLKPLEIEMEFFLRSAWEAGKETTTATVPGFTAEWVDTTFSGGHGDAAAAIYTEYYQLNNQRKLEHLTSNVFQQVGHGDEASRRLGALRRLFDETNTILESLPETERVAFFQLFAIKIHLAYLTNAEFYFADRSSLALHQGKAAAADRAVETSRAFARTIRALIDYYNHRMSDGRWSGMFTPQQFPPPVMPMHPVATPALTTGTPGLGVTVWGAATASAPVLHFWPYGLEEKWIEVFTTGADSVDYFIEADSWIEVGSSSGSVKDEQRISVRIADPEKHAGRHGRLHVSSRDSNQSFTIAVHVADAPEKIAGFHGAVEADGFLSLDPSRPDRSTLGMLSEWRAVEHLGRYGNSAMQSEPRAAQGTAQPSSSLSDTSALEFDIHLRTPGAHILEVHRLPTLNATARIRLAVGVDELPAAVIESPTTDEHRGAWSSTVQDNVERLLLELPWLDAGSHVLRVHAVDDFVAISKVVIYTEDPVLSNLGPEFSQHTDRRTARRTDPNPTSIDPRDIEREAAALYGIDPAEVPLPEQLYAGHDFWDGPTTFRRPRSLPQPTPTEATPFSQRSRPEDRLAGLGSSVFTETNGVIAFEAEHALADTANAWRTRGVLDPTASWTHTSAETADGAGLAMQVEGRGARWDDPDHAPGMHYALSVTSPGTYRAWLLTKFDDDQDDSCVLSIDGQAQPISEQFSRGELCAYGLRQVWVWAAISDVDLTAGTHTFSILARKTGLRIDRVYLTRGDELPPIDAEWTTVPRAN